ncbi:hypothetical protein PG996_014176 [Apiospora saccharicola]|uniref:Mid2 domain-containing protein n=1 Tax=Apiospora saccharicola TaxID=335842 RepID=A0ABR1THR8_9PEZI
MTSHTGIFTSAVSVESSLVTTTDINGFASTITTKSVAAAILSWLPDGNYTYLTYTYLPFRTDTGDSPAATSTDHTPETTTSVSAAPSTNAGLSGGAIAGIVVGAVVGVAILAALCWLIFRYRRKALGRQQKGIMGHRGPEDVSGHEGHLDQQHQYPKEHPHELGEPDHTPRQTQQQYQKPELDASASEVPRS